MITVGVPEVNAGWLLTLANCVGLADSGLGTNAGMIACPANVECVCIRFLPPSKNP